MDGKFIANDIWEKILDVHGNEYGSKWYLILCPQIEKIVAKRAIPVLYLNPLATFYFISKITNFTTFELTKTDIIKLLKHENDATWLNSWRLQFRMIDRKYVAATVIQATWRGYTVNIISFETKNVEVLPAALYSTAVNVYKLFYLFYSNKDFGNIH